ncbi:hypothetical protein SK128_002823 [Halocaridina rubra]|uniref:BRCT domain-containing protein n=1 Tax=Halocaridina rubra TaxID=373956 RepID=A0AAN9A8K9_HALRR
MSQPLTINTQSAGFGDTSIFLVPEGIQDKRYQVLLRFASKNGFKCKSDINERLSHVVSELKDIDQLSRLYPKLSEKYEVKIVSPQWLHTSVRQKSLVSEEEFLIPGYHRWIATKDIEFQIAGHQAKRQIQIGDEEERDAKLPKKFEKNRFNENICERNAPLQHHNQVLVEPLLFLNEYWTVMGDERRALAYSKAAATIKCLPFTVTTLTELDDLKGLGSGHCLKVIQETLERGHCQEVIVKRDSMKFQSLKILSSVYGIGPSLALKLHSNHGVSSVQDILKLWNQLALADERIKVGVTYYADLSTPVSCTLAKKIKGIVEYELSIIKDDFRIEIAGGFRRGKKNGHDVDILITYTTDGEEKGILSSLMKHLNHKGYILHWRLEKSSFDEEAVFTRSPDQISVMDHFEKSFCVFKCPLQGNEIPETERTIRIDVNEPFPSQEQRNWRAIRVDLIMVPKSQWAYALLGWTGSKLFMRMLRHYSNAHLQKTLNSHGLWDKRENKLIPAESEEDVFKNLGLSYKDPSHRNF